VSIYEILGVIFGVVSVYLTVRQNIWCWPTGLVNVGLFIIVFFQAKLYADMGLQVLYVVLCLYGWYAWLHGGAHHGPLKVSRIPARALGGLLVAGVALALPLAFFLRKATDASMPLLDASTSSFSVVAQAMQTKKWIENWWVWILVDVVYVGMYVVKGLYLTAGLYGLFLVLAVMGLAQWRKARREAACVSESDLTRPEGAVPVAAEVGRA
jgi:nicotinamide mononucleotide transporter